MLLLSKERFLSPRLANIMPVYLGVVWELATGDKPYRGLNMARLVHRVLVSGGRPALPLWLPAAYARLVTSCWAQVGSAGRQPEGRAARTIG